MRLLLTAALLLPAALRAQAADSAARARECSSCAEWNAAHAPFRILGNTYYVGTDGLSAVLVTSPRGHVLLDGGLPESAPRILANIRALGFRPEDVRLILNSHAHFDHAGGIAALRRATGAPVMAHPWSARAMRAGRTAPGDPQEATLLAYPAVPRVGSLRDGETVRVGPLRLTAHFTPGHTPGSTTWSWRSCEGDTACADVVYADSQTPVSSDGFFFTRSTTFPNAVSQFTRGIAVIESLPCDVLVTPHPSASRLFERQASGTLREPGACRAYAATAREALARRVEQERAAP